MANAVYLKADWAVPFAEVPTEDRPFTLADGSTAQVPMMANLVPARWAEGDRWTAVDLPYVGGRLAMRVVVPTGSRTPARGAREGRQGIR